MLHTAHDFGVSNHASIMQNARTNSKCLLHYSLRYASSMTDKAARLRIAREKMFDTASAAADAMGIPNSTYTQHENGERGFPAKKAERYAKFFRVTPEWLLYGRGDGPDMSSDPSDAEWVAMIETAIREIPATASIGDWPRLAAPILREQLERYRADRVARANEAASTSPGKSSQPHGSTRKGVTAG